MHGSAKPVLQVNAALVRCQANLGTRSSLVQSSSRGMVLWWAILARTRELWQGAQHSKNAPETQNNLHCVNANVARAAKGL